MNVNYSSAVPQVAFWITIETKYNLPFHLQTWLQSMQFELLLKLFKGEVEYSLFGSKGGKLNYY